MTRSNIGFVCTALLAIALCSTTNAHTDFTVGTANTSNFDLDGPVLETQGDLGTNTAQATIFAPNLPTEFVTGGVTALTLDVVGSRLGGNGNIASEATTLSPDGIGVVGGILSDELGPGEALSFSLSSVSTGAQPVITGLVLDSFRDSFFPFSTFTLTGATFNGGDTTFDGEFDDLPLAFDNPVSSVTITSTTGDGASDFVVSGVSVAIPEPGSIVLLLTASLAIVSRRH